MGLLAADGKPLEYPVLTGSPGFEAAAESIGLAGHWGPAKIHQDGQRVMEYTPELEEHLVVVDSNQAEDWFPSTAADDLNFEAVVVESTVLQGSTRPVSLHRVDHKVTE